MKRIRSNAGGNYFSSPKTNISFISSGCRTLDLALGGGWAEGRIANVVGDKSTGKSLLCIEAAANFIIKHPRSTVRYRESESAFDISYAEALGMPVDRVDLDYQPDTIEDLFEDLEKVIEKANRPELYICDSLDSLSDRAELARTMDDGSYGTGKAKKLSELFRRLVRKMRDKNLTLMIVSQVRSRIGTVSFGRNTTRAGGRALDFYATHVLYLAKLMTVNQTVDNSKRAIGVDIRAKVDKNKIGLPFREADFMIHFGFGVDDLRACLGYLKQVKQLKTLDLADDKKSIEKFARRLEEIPMKEYRKELSRVHQVVEAHWYDVEKSLIPRRRKYEIVEEE